VKIKPGRCKDDWAKSTQRYYGLIHNYTKTQNIAGELKIHKSVDEGSNYYLDKFLALTHFLFPKHLYI
jgi:hypothetical protein